jgi:hypothetical protein
MSPGGVKTPQGGSGFIKKFNILIIGFEKMVKWSKKLCRKVSSCRRKAKDSLQSLIF